MTSAEVFQQCCRKLRFDAIRQLRWHGRALPPELKTQLSPLEQQYFKSYDKLLTKYMSKGEDGVGMDLTLVSLLCICCKGEKSKFWKHSRSR